MIDIHSHIIYGVDDGPKSLDESKNMLKAASRAGVKTIIATPHFGKELFEDSVFQNHYLKLLDETKRKMERAAKDLDFMEAARLRDEMLEIEKMVKERK